MNVFSGSDVYPVFAGSAIAVGQQAIAVADGWNAMIAYTASRRATSRGSQSYSVGEISVANAGLRIGKAQGTAGVRGPKCALAAELPRGGGFHEAQNRPAW